MEVDEKTVINSEKVLRTCARARPCACACARSCALYCSAGRKERQEPKYVQINSKKPQDNLFLPTDSYQLQGNLVSIILLDVAVNCDISALQ